MTDTTNTPHDGNAFEEALADDAAATARGRIGWLGVTVAIIFGIFYAYALWSALGQLIDLPGEFEDAGVTGAPWGLTLAGLLTPIVLFALAFWLGIRRNIGDKILIYVVGLLAVAALSFTFIGFEHVVLNNAVALLGP
jgi:formate/nitrite transporter FocA (FNT family)